MDHQNDDNIPTFKVLWYNRDPERPPKDDILGLVMMNQIDSPYLFSVQNGNLVECYEYTSLNKPLVDRPKDSSGDVMDA